MRTLYKGAINEVRSRGYFVPSYCSWRNFEFSKINKHGIEIYGSYRDGDSSVCTVKNPKHPYPGCARREGAFWRDELLDALDILEDIDC